MRKDYQNKKIDTNQPVVPETVSVALTELAGELQGVCWPSRLGLVCR